MEQFSTFKSFLGIQIQDDELIKFFRSKKVPFQAVNYLEPKILEDGQIHLISKSFSGSGVLIISKDRIENITDILPGTILLPVVQHLCSLKTNVWPFGAMHETLENVKFYIYLCEIVSVESKLALDKTDSRYGYFVSVLKRFMNLDETVEQDCKNIKTFFQENRQYLDKLNNLFDHNPVLLSDSSADAIVFDISRDKVIKFFISRTLFEKYKEQQDNLHLSPLKGRSEVNIYDLGNLTYSEDRSRIKIYYVITSKLKPVVDANLFNKKVDKLDAGIFTTLKTIVDLCYLHGRKLGRELSKDVKELFKKKLFVCDLINAKVDSDNLKKIKNFYHLNDQWLYKLVEEILVKTLGGHNDFHLGNLGATKDGDLKFFDSFYG